MWMAPYMFSIHEAGWYSNLIRFPSKELLRLMTKEEKKKKKKEASVTSLPMIRGTWNLLSWNSRRQKTLKNFWRMQLIEGWSGRKTTSLREIYGRLTKSKEMHVGQNMNLYCYTSSYPMQDWIAPGGTDELSVEGQKGFSSYTMMQH